MLTKSSDKTWCSDKYLLEKGLRSQAVCGNMFTCKSADSQRSIGVTYFTDRFLSLSSFQLLVLFVSSSKTAASTSGE